MSTTVAEYVPHPAAQLFPMLGDDDLQKLAEDIHQNGLLEPIVLFDDMILDGRNRYTACQIAGVDPRFTVYAGPMSPTLFALSKNLHRRHLTISQRTVIAIEMLPLLHEEARKRLVTSTGGNEPRPLSKRTEAGEEGTARKIAADAVGVSESSVQRALRVRGKDPAAYEQLKQGNTKVNTIYAGSRGNCSVEGCNGGVTSRGMCQKHYIRKKTTGTTDAPITRADRVESIRAMAAEGHRADQIAEQIGVRAGYVRLLARESGIPIADTIIGKVRKCDSNRIVEQTILSASGLIAGLELINPDDLDKTKAPEWIAALTDSIASLSRLLRLLRKL